MASLFAGLFSKSPSATGGLFATNSKFKSLENPIKPVSSTFTKLEVENGFSRHEGGAATKRDAAKASNKGGVSSEEASRGAKEPVYKKSKKSKKELVAELAEPVLKEAGTKRQQKRPAEEAGSTLATIAHRSDGNKVPLTATETERGTDGTPDTAAPAQPKSHKKRKHEAVTTTPAAKEPALEQDSKKSEKKKGKQGSSSVPATSTASDEKPRMTEPPADPARAHVVLGLDPPAAPSGAKRRIEHKAPVALETQDGTAWDEALGRTVFVGNLPGSITKKALQRLFERCGKITSVRLRSIATNSDSKMHRKAALLAGDIDSSRGSGHAYVVFKDQGAVDSALELNMTQFEGRHVRVDRAALPSRATIQKGGGVTKPADGPGVQYDPTRSVFVGNLAHDIEDEDVIRFFSDGSVSTELRMAVEAVRVVRDRFTLVAKGVAFVLFKTRSAARSAALLDGRELKGRRVRVRRVQPSVTDGESKKKSWQGTIAGDKRGDARAQKTSESFGRPRASGLAGHGREGSGPRRIGSSLHKPAGKPAAKPRSPGLKRPSVAARKARQRAARRTP